MPISSICSEFFAENKGEIIMKSRKKIHIEKRKRKNRLNLNIGLIIFALIFLYLGISCFLYLTREKIAIYEVVSGESEAIPGIDTTGITLRAEEITTAPSTGYINFYVKDGNRVSVNETLYTIDESGSFSELLKEAAQNKATLTADNISDLRNEVTSFITTYNHLDFEKTYDFKYDLNASLIESVNLNALEEINRTLVENGNNMLDLIRSTTSGVIEFYTDGMENLTLDNITKEIFDQASYHKKTIAKDKPTEAGSPIFKTITSEDWQIVIPLTDDEFATYSDKDTVDIIFRSEKIRTTAVFSTFTNNSGHFGVISLKRYMIKFAGKRFVDLSIVADTKPGLKVPKTALTHKEFFTVPDGFITNGGDSKENGVLIEKIKDDGTSEQVFQKVSVLDSIQGTSYIEGDGLDFGVIICKEKSDEKYQLGSMAKLTGVYNVNTGLTSFRYVKIMSEKNGYYIVEPKSSLGLMVYDQIVLNASMVKENQIIFK